MQTSPLLKVIDLCKSYPGVRALDRVNLEVRAGEVHALMGENGAGKSTLMRLLAGLERPDAGEIHFQGTPVSLRHPHQAFQLGISMIHQELMPIPALSVAENIFLGHESGDLQSFWIKRKALNRRAAELLDRLAASIPPDRVMGQLSVAEMQTVEIAKAMAHECNVLIMDEPTSALSVREVEALFKLIHDLRQDGVAILYISHKMDEVFRVADVISVLRDGHYLGTHVTSDLGEDELIRLMVGRELAPSMDRSPGCSEEAVLELRRFGRSPGFVDVDLQVHRGEVVGIAGLMGAGRSALANAIYGLEPATAGALLLEGESAQVRDPGDALRQGIALVSEDRKEYGLVLPMSVRQNLTLSNLRLCSAGPFIREQQERTLADDQITRFGIKTADRDQAVASLSGGNQQKVVLAKALLGHPRLLILDEPTRGIDIGAKAEVHTLIHELAASGLAILLISSELPELLALSHRILVMREGRVRAEFETRQVSAEEIMTQAMGTRED